MAVTQVQKQQGVNTTSAGPTCTFGASPTQNNLLIACIGLAAVANQTITPPSGWTLVTGEPIDSTGDVTTPWSSRLVAIAYKVAGAGETSAVTWALGTSVNWDITALEYSGLVTSSPEDKTIVANNNSAVMSLNLGTTATTSQAVELAVAFCGQAQRTGSAFDNSFVLESTDGFRLMLGTKILAATAAVNTTASWTSATSTAAGGIVTFLGITVTQISDGDTGTGTDAGESIAAALPDADTGSGVDAGESVAVSVSDGETGTLVDTESVFTGAVADLIPRRTTHRLDARTTPPLEGRRAYRRRP